MCSMIEKNTVTVCRYRTGTTVQVPADNPFAFCAYPKFSNPDANSQIPDSILNLGILLNPDHPNIGIRLFGVNPLKFPDKIALRLM